MNPQEYELWYEYFSGVLRFNPRWDLYDRTAMELFRKKTKPLSVVEFGFSRPKIDPATDRYFTQQLSWIADHDFARCLSITTDDRAPELAKDHYKKLKVFVPNEGSVVNYFKAKIHEIEIGQADLLLLSEGMPGAWDWSVLKPGALVIAEGPYELNGHTGLKKVFSGPIPLWRKP